jgi:hypothetical protein
MSTNQACIVCSGELIQDYTSGDLICTDCGLVSEDHLMCTTNVISSYDPFVSMCTGLLENLNAPSGWLNDCNAIFNSLPQEKRKVTKLCVGAIVCIVCKQIDDYIPRVIGFSKISKNRLLKTIKDLQHLDVVNTNTVIHETLMKVAHNSTTCSFKELKQINENYLKCLSKINRSPTAIACALFVLYFDIDIKKISVQNGITDTTIKKIIKEIHT